MKFSQRWWVIVVLLVAFSATVSFLSAQTEEPSTVNAPSSAAVQSDTVEVQSSSDEPEQKQPKQPMLGPGRDMATDVETTRLYNEFRSKFLDDRAKIVDWWLEATAIFLTLIGVAAAILGYFGFKRLDRIESEARENVEASEKHAQEAKRYKEEAKRNLEETRVSRDESQSITERLKAELADNAPYKTDEEKKNGQQKSDSPLLDQAVAAAESLHQQNKIGEAIEKWRSIANIAEGTDNELAAQAWFSVGYLLSPENTPGDNFEEAIDAYGKAIDLNLSGPNLPYAYYNRGNAKLGLGQIEAAIADYNKAIDLNRYDAIAYFNRGNAKAISGQTEAAIADYNKAIDLNSSYANAYFNRGYTQSQKQNSDEARQDFETVLNLAQAAGDLDLTARAERALENLARGEAP